MRLPAASGGSPRSASASTASPVTPWTAVASISAVIRSMTAAWIAGSLASGGRSRRSGRCRRPCVGPAATTESGARIAMITIRTVATTGRHRRRRRPDRLDGRATVAGAAFTWARRRSTSARSSSTSELWGSAHQDSQTAIRRTAGGTPPPPPGSGDDQPDPDEHHQNELQLVRREEPTSRLAILQETYPYFLGKFKRMLCDLRSVIKNLVI